MFTCRLWVTTVDDSCSDVLISDCGCTTDVVFGKLYVMVFVMCLVYMTQFHNVYFSNDPMRVIR